MRLLQSTSLALIVACAGQTAFASDDRADIERAEDRSAVWSLSVGAETSTSKFGARGEQEVTYIPVGVGVSFGGWSLGIDSGWLDGSLKFPGVGAREVTIPSIGGRPARTIVLPGTAGREFSANGVADTTVSARYDFAPVADMVAFAIAGDVKLPTADDSKGLGSGEVDYSVSGEIGGTGVFAPFAGAGVQVLGEPAGVSYDPAAFGYAGLDVAATDALQFGVVYDYSQAASEGVDDFSAVSGTLRWRITPQVRVSFTAKAGLSESAPETLYGVRLSLRNR